jgi:hypothetical protein
MKVAQEGGGFQDLGTCTEFTENRGGKNRESAAFNRKSPPFETKGGAPSSFIVRRCNMTDPRPRHILRAWGNQRWC